MSDDDLAYRKQHADRLRLVAENYCRKCEVIEKALTNPKFSAAEEKAEPEEMPFARLDRLKADINFTASMRLSDAALATAAGHAPQCQEAE